MLTRWILHKERLLPGELHLLHCELAKGTEPAVEDEESDLKSEITSPTCHGPQCFSKG